MTVLGLIAGFLWGQQVGIRQGKAAMLKMLENQLNQPSPESATAFINGRVHD
jgi:hypothetical protein